MPGSDSTHLIADAWQILLILKTLSKGWESKFRFPMGSVEYQVSESSSKWVFCSHLSLRNTLSESHNGHQLVRGSEKLQQSNLLAQNFPTYLVPPAKGLPTPHYFYSINTHRIYWLNSDLIKQYLILPQLLLLIHYHFTRIFGGVYSDKFCKWEFHLFLIPLMLYNITIEKESMTANVYYRQRWKNE